MAFPCNTKCDGAVDPGSLQVQDQPGPFVRLGVCKRFGVRGRAAAAAACCPALEGLLCTLQNKTQVCCDEFTRVVQGTWCARNNLSVWSVPTGQNCSNGCEGEAIGTLTTEQSGQEMLLCPGRAGTVAAPQVLEGALALAIARVPAEEGGTVALGQRSRPGILRCAPLLLPHGPAAPNRTHRPFPPAVLVQAWEQGESWARILLEQSDRDGRAPLHGTEGGWLPARQYVDGLGHGSGSCYAKCCQMCITSHVFLCRTFHLNTLCQEIFLEVEHTWTKKMKQQELPFLLVRAMELDDGTWCLRFTQQWKKAAAAQSLE
ncbi:uncharacterized protein LOC135447220 [Zonotrichia leucophrys gambelii]|uniref:uncharacterized protein LOC135447220 n=1 Tax=Zonotrichia leucophrys gambelii TaxID=257770 RepID=UPI0031408984